MKTFRCHRQQSVSIFNASGFTLIEVLIAMVILAIGILGTLAMQTRGLMDNQDAYLRTQAVFLAYDMSDRIRANVIGWAIVPVPAEHDCISDCTPEEMAAYDYWRWQTNALNTLSGASGDITLNGAMCSSGANASGLRIQLTWQRANKDMNDKLGDACYSMDVRL